MLDSAQWGEYRIGDLFEIKPTKSYGLTNADLFATEGNVPVVTNTSVSNGISARVGLAPTEKGGIITYSDTTTSDAIFYQPEDFIGYSHVQGLYPKQNVWTEKSLLFFVIAFRKSAQGKFDYGNKFNRAIAREMQVLLPIRTVGAGAAPTIEQIDFAFIENFIARLEAERIARLEAERIARLEAYLLTTGLSHYELTKEEKEAIDALTSEKMEWQEYEYREIFNRIQQGKRLKKDDQQKGDIPFVMAGFTNTGVVNYICNPVRMFPANSITVDIFGNTFYRNYAYGAGDDTGVYWSTEKEYSTEAMLFFATAMHKSIQGSFSFGNKLRSSQSLNIKMMLPKGVESYFMHTLIRAIEKLVIADVVRFADERISATREVVG